MNSQWVQILSGDLAKSAHEAVSAVAIDIASRSVDRETDSRLCGFAMLFGYLARWDNSPVWFDRAEECLRLASERVSARNRNCGLHGGLSGVGWTIQHLQSALAETDSQEEATESEDLVSELDDLILRRLDQDPRATRSYDLIEGLVGVGLYCLDRLPSRSAHQGLRVILDHLEASAERRNDDVSWFTAPEMLPDWQREMCPDGYYNLGVAHGIPGVIWFLAELVRASVEPVRAQRLLEGSVRWLLSRQREAGASTRFSHWFVPGRAPSDSRLAWCYGDLGLAAVLHYVATTVRRDDWLTTARTVIDKCAEWPFRLTGVVDAGLCHGACGVAHMFNRVFQTDSLPHYREAAVSWYARALAMRQPGSGVGGFTAWHPKDATVDLDLDPSFLAGGPGIALALLSAVTEIAPGWDRLLALSGPLGVSSIPRT